MQLTKDEATRLRNLRLAIGANIHAARVRRRMTLERCAAAGGLPAKMLDLYELGRGEINLQTAVRLAQVLDVPLASLFHDGLSHGLNGYITKA